MNNYKRLFFNQMSNTSQQSMQLSARSLSMKSDTFADPNTENFKLGEDYFSYALFAFYIFDNKEKMIVETETRFTEKSSRRAMSIASNKRAMSGSDFTPEGSLLSQDKLIQRTSSLLERNSADDMTRLQPRESLAGDHIDMLMQERNKASLIMPREDLEAARVRFAPSEATSTTDDPDIDL
jgi:hypothetical protein